jgi:ribosome-associated translation inhibitor RaiA
MNEQLVDPSVETRGRVTDDERAYSLEKLRHVSRFAPGPILHARLRLHHEPDPGRERPAIAEASLDINGRAVRAHVAAPTMREAIDLLEARLRRRIDRLAERDQALRLRHRDAGSGEWHHGDAQARRPEFFDRPVEERDVVRRKAFTLEAETPDEAVLDLELLDHDFLLFHNAATDQDSLIHRIGDRGYSLIQSNGNINGLEGCVAPIRPSAFVPARIRLDDATRLLDLGDEPFVFFIDSRTRRGNVVYRRYDGHYGLIVPAD